MAGYSARHSSAHNLHNLYRLWLKSAARGEFPFEPSKADPTKEHSVVALSIYSDECIAGSAEWADADGIPAINTEHRNLWGANPVKLRRSFAVVRRAHEMPFEYAISIEQLAGQTDGKAAPLCMHQSVGVTKASKAWAFGLMALALAVALWGFGGKLSQFNLHSDAFWRTSFARLWDKHPDPPAIGKTAKVTAQSHFRLEQRAFLAILDETSQNQYELLGHSIECKSIPPSSSSSFPLRSPPSRNVPA